MRKLSVVSMVATLVAVGAYGVSAHEHPAPPPASESLQRVQSLKGVWEGADPMNKEGGKLTVEYQPTSGGSAVMERLGPGTPHEMISMYYDRDGKVEMTHYC